MSNTLRISGIVLTMSLLSFQKTVDTIVLQAQSLPFTPKEYYIADVEDQRPERGAFARLITASGRGPEAVDLRGGTAPAIEAFLKQSLKQNQSLRPILIRIKGCKLTETASGGRVSGKLTLNLAFAVRQEEDLLPLMEYTGGASYERPVSQTSLIEPTVRQTLIAGLRTFNEWINREANRHPALARRLQIEFVDIYHSTDRNNDTVFYAPSRPLTWDDFRADVPKVTRYAAQVMPSIAYEGHGEVVNGAIKVKLRLKVYTLKSGSWVTERALNSYSLNHEQRHFDVAKIVMERFRRKLNPDSLSLTDYNSNIQYHYIESFREMGQMQEKYDGETNHGINTIAQARWNDYIDDELLKYGLKK